jgi:hypothetical protein
MMSVIMTAWLEGNPRGVEEFAANRDEMQAVLESAKSHGLIAHRFYGSEEGQVMVFDEWPDEQTFSRSSRRTAAGSSRCFGQPTPRGGPRINFWHKLDTDDDVGWGA